MKDASAKSFNDVEANLMAPQTDQNEINLETNVVTINVMVFLFFRMLHL